MSERSKDKFVLWTNHFLGIDEQNFEFYKEEYPEFSEEDHFQFFLDDNEFLFQELQKELDYSLNENIVLIANIGRWNGRFIGYKELGNNLKDCLQAEGDYSTWYIDKKGDLNCEDTHHDSTNYYLYRSFKSNLSEERQKNFLEKIYYGTVTRQDITRCTNKLGDVIAKTLALELKPNYRKREVR